MVGVAGVYNGPPVMAPPPYVYGAYPPPRTNTRFPDAWQTKNRPCDFLEVVYIFLYLPMVQQYLAIKSIYAYGDSLFL